MNIASCSLQKEGTWRVHKNSNKKAANETLHRNVVLLTVAPRS